MSIHWVRLMICQPTERLRLAADGRSLPNEVARQADIGHMLPHTLVYLCRDILTEPDATLRVETTMRTEQRPLADARQLASGSAVGQNTQLKQCVSACLSHQYGFSLLVCVVVAALSRCDSSPAGPARYYYCSAAAASNALSTRQEAFFEQLRYKNRKVSAKAQCHKMV